MKILKISKSRTPFEGVIYPRPKIGRFCVYVLLENGPYELLSSIYGFYHSFS